MIEASLNWQIKLVLFFNYERLKEEFSLLFFFFVNVGTNNSLRAKMLFIQGHSFYPHPHWSRHKPAKKFFSEQSLEKTFLGWRNGCNRCVYKSDKNGSLEPLTTIYEVFEITFKLRTLIFSSKYEKFRVVAFVEELTLIQYQSVKKYESNCFQYLHPHPQKIPQTRWRVDCKKGLRKQNDPFGETTMEWKWNMETVRLLRFT